jgi:hypothetical protein
MLSFQVKIGISILSQWYRDDIISEMIDPTSDGMVSISDFKIFCQWFGPMKSCMKNMKLLIQQSYFYGSLSTYESQTLLDSKKFGSYLVRFNEKEPGNFIISCVDETEIDGEYLTIHFKVFTDFKNYFLKNDENISNHISELIQKYPLTFRIPLDDDEVRMLKTLAFQNNDPSVSFFSQKKKMMNFTHFRGKTLLPMHVEQEDLMMD